MPAFAPYMFPLCASGEKLIFAPEGRVKTEGAKA
jgi:hypothetical protein